MLSSSSLIIMLCGVTIAAFSQILLKTSANIKYDSFIKQYMNKRVILGYVMLLISMFFSVWAYGGMELKYGPAIESVAVALVTILSTLILKEKMTRKKLTGIVMIIGGLVVFCLG